MPGRLEALEELYLNNNCLKEINFEENDFPRLKHLMLDQNKLEKVSFGRSFISLKTLSISKPFLTQLTTN